MKKKLISAVLVAIVSQSPIAQGAEVPKIGIPASDPSSRDLRHAIERPNARLAGSFVIIDGATVIDGNGGLPLKDGIIVIRDDRIVSVGSRASTAIPRAAHRINARGKFATPGFVDTNVHLSLLAGDESYARYWDKEEELITEAAQLWLKHGVTTVHDSYGLLAPLEVVRDSIAAGHTVGPRLLVAGNIVGWGTLGSMTFGGADGKPGWSMLSSRLTRDLTQGVGEDLLYMSPDQVRASINKYLDKGPDFIKYGGTAHTSDVILFSPRVQQVIVDEAHKRGKFVETHATGPEALRLAVLAGVDLVQHPEQHDVLIPDEIVALMRERHVVCSMIVGYWTGSAWKNKVLGDDEKADLEFLRNAAAKSNPVTEGDREFRKFSWTIAARPNAEKLVKGGCTVSVASDVGITGHIPSYDKSKEIDGAPWMKWDIYKPGLGTLRGIEGLVELGMSPIQAITAATKNGALAYHGSADYGTLEVGKKADILLLDADPLVDIKNVEALSMVMVAGKVIDISKLPSNPVVGFD